MKRLLSLLLGTALLAVLLAGCGGAPAGTEDTPSEDAQTEPDTGDASLDNPRNQDEIGEKELLVVSFGTSYNDNRRQTIGAIEAAMETAFPDYSVRRAFTSQIILDKVRDRDGVAMDNVQQALDRAVDNGVQTLIIQPTHLMNGLEYNELVDTAAQYADAFQHLAIEVPGQDTENQWLEPVDPDEYAKLK